MITRGNNVLGGIRRAIGEDMEERLLSKIDENTVVREEDSSQEVRNLRPELNNIIRTFGSSHLVLIDISCPFRCVSWGANTLEKVYIDKKEKYSKSAQETSNVRETRVETILIIVSSLHAMHARSRDALRNILLCDDKKTKKIRRRLSEAAIRGRWKYGENMQKTCHVQKIFE
jgi:hypothetical protein